MNFICPGKEMTFRLEDLETIVGHDASADMFRFWAEEHIHQRRSYEEQSTCMLIDSSQHINVKHL